MEKTAYDVLAETRTSVEEILAKMLFIKKEGRNRAELRELATQASVAFLNLRQINRIILQDEDRTKQETEAAKLPVDYTTLQLNNLLYQKNHYLKAINACKDFKSKYPDIELVSEDDFFRDAPEEFKKDPLLKSDPHKRMLERLNFELYQRKELCKQRELLDARKKMLQESITNRKKFLSSLPSHLKALKKASLPVQQQLGIMHTKRMKQHHLAELLPAPLYILYTQILAQKEAFDEDMDLEIIGNAKEAQSIARQHAMKDPGVNLANPDESKPDDDPPEDDDDSRRRKRVKKSHQKEAIDDKIYYSHPLCVLWHIYDDDHSANEKPNKLLTLRFEYLIKLNVVCTGVDGAHDGPLDLLTNLFPDDTGLDLPTQVSKLSAGLDFRYDTKRTLHPYRWAQHLAGMDFLFDCPPSILDMTPLGGEHSKGTLVTKGLAAYRRQHRVQTIVDKLRGRRKDHLSLKDQLDAFTNLKFPPLNFTKVPWDFHSAKCCLHSWVEVTPTLGLPKSFVNVVASTMALAHGHVQMDGGMLSPRNLMESAREDGELPSLGLGAAAPRYMGLSYRKGSSFRERRHKENHFSNTAFVASQESILAGLHDLDGGDIVDEDVLTGLVEDSYENTLPDATSDSSMFQKAMASWEDCGARVFMATLRRDDGAGEQGAVMEAQVKISSEYPIRPPQFTLALASNGLELVLPAAPSGVLDTAEAPRTSSASVQSFNELRAIEIEVNLHVMEIIPQWEENRILAHQMCLLAMLFDRYVDHQLLIDNDKRLFQSNDKGKSGHGGLEPTSRLMRGRDRQMLLC